MYSFNSNGCVRRLIHSKLSLHFGKLDLPKNKAAFLKASGMNIAAMIAAQALLIASGSHSSPKTIFLKECCIILVQILLLKLIISEHPR